MPAGLSAASLAVLAAAVFFAGVVDAIAGGGGLVTIPAYFAVGLNPAFILGTNKLCSAIGTVASAWRYRRTLRFHPPRLKTTVLVAFLGSVLGARAALWLDPGWLRYLLLGGLPVIALLVYLKRDLGALDQTSRHAPAALFRRTLAAAFPISAYDGFFGPGTGTFFTLALTRGCGYDLLRATAYAKILNLASNVAALAAFLAAGKVEIRLGLAMSAASIAGHYAGSLLGLKKGAAVIRPLLLVVIAATFLKIIFQR